jgi:hypothetical protein
LTPRDFAAESATMVRAEIIARSLSASAANRRKINGSTSEPNSAAMSRPLAASNPDRIVVENPWTFEKTKCDQWRVFPSHGRGRRFNPYSAHHFTGFLGSIRQLHTERNVKTISRSVENPWTYRKTNRADIRQTKSPGRCRGFKFLPFKIGSIFRGDWSLAPKIAELPIEPDAKRLDLSID